MILEIHDELIGIQRRLIALFDVTEKLARRDARCAEMERHNRKVTVAMVEFMHCCLHTSAVVGGTAATVSSKHEGEAVVIAPNGTQWNKKALEKFRKLLIQALTESAPAASRVKEGRKTK